MDALIVTIETFLAAALRQAAPLTLAGIVTCILMSFLAQFV